MSSPRLPTTSTATLARPMAIRGRILVFAGLLCLSLLVVASIKLIADDTVKANKRVHVRRQFQLGGALKGGAEQPVLSLLADPNAMHATSRAEAVAVPAPAPSSETQSTEASPGKTTAWSPKQTVGSSTPPSVSIAAITNVSSAAHQKSTSSSQLASARPLTSVVSSVVSSSASLTNAPQQTTSAGGSLTHSIGGGTLLPTGLVPVSESSTLRHSTSSSGGTLLPTGLLPVPETSTLRQPASTGVAGGGIPSVVKGAGTGGSSTPTIPQSLPSRPQISSAQEAPSGDPKGGQVTTPAVKHQGALDLQIKEPALFKLRKFKVTSNTALQPVPANLMLESQCLVLDTPSSTPYLVLFARHAMFAIKRAIRSLNTRTIYQLQVWDPALRQVSSVRSVRTVGSALRERHNHNQSPAASTPTATRAVSLATAPVGGTSGVNNVGSSDNIPIPMEGQVPSNNLVPSAGQTPSNGQALNNPTSNSNQEVSNSGQAPSNSLDQHSGPALNSRPSSNNGQTHNGQAPNNRQHHSNGQPPNTGQPQNNGNPPYNSQAPNNGQIPSDGAAPNTGPAPNSLPAVYTGTMVNVMSWSNLGCFQDSVYRTLIGAKPTDYLRGAMTNNVCISHCSSRGYGFAGTENSEECWCGTAIRNDAIRLPDSYCEMPCQGATATACGGSWAVLVYQYAERRPESQPLIEYRSLNERLDSKSPEHQAAEDTTAGFVRLDDKIGIQGMRNKRRRGVAAVEDLDHMDIGDETEHISGR
ncbi:hypothetical protein G7046_g6795 [Stylonectria norvegica]|nr:hypothetical protein G7046_g6795 [Stylonectria norvegica]